MSFSLKKNIRLKINILITYASVAVKISHLIYFMKKFYKCCTFNAICKDNAAINCHCWTQKRLVPEHITNFKVILQLLFLGFRGWSSVLNFGFRGEPRHPEDGNWKVLRNVGLYSTFDAVNPRKPKLYNIIAGLSQAWATFKQPRVGSSFLIMAACHNTN
jgi:hypothetical protein